MGKSTHGHAGSHEYKIWAQIKERCLNQKGRSYPKFGGAGVKMHDPWVSDFAAFLRDVGSRPSPSHRLERSPDRLGAFVPGNLKWVAQHEIVGSEEIPTEEWPERVKAVVARPSGNLHVEKVFRVRLSSGKTHYKVRCVCICGKTKEIFYTGYGKAQSCGCRRTFLATTGDNNPAFKGHRGIRATHWSRIVRRAKQRGWLLPLSIQEAWEIYLNQGGCCALSGVPIDFGPCTKRALTTASLDRIDSTRGYERDNVQWVHKTVNLMKNAMPDAEFVQWCRRVSSHQGTDAYTTHG